MHGLRLVAEDVGGRRNRIDTVLVTRLAEPGDGERGSRTTTGEEPTHA